MEKKKITVWEDWVLKATVAGNINSYIDTDIYGAGLGSYDVEYKIRSVDRTNHISDPSVVVSLDWGNSMQKRTAIANYEDKLFGNYPNPFNPLTKIKYSLKDDKLSKNCVEIKMKKAITLTKFGKNGG